MISCPNCGHELHDKPVPLTLRQLCALRFICRHIAEHGVAPRHQDIADGIGGNKGSAGELIGQLRRKRWIMVHPYVPRGIEVLHDPPRVKPPLRVVSQ